MTTMMESAIFEVLKPYRLNKDGCKKTTTRKSFTMDLGRACGVFRDTLKPVRVSGEEGQTHHIPRPRQVLLLPCVCVCVCAQVRLGQILV